jgi:16S rRNA (guanine966-N2)-methyltransferase
MKPVVKLNPPVLARPPTKPAGLVRIIGGQWKRTPIKVANAPGLRPTPDRVRETLFNWIGPAVNASHCLDLFAGTGALGFEAASRGAASVLMSETSGAACTSVKALKLKLGAQQITLMELDALSVLRWCERQNKQFNLVFLDPPFGQGWAGKVLPLVAKLLAPQAMVYLESEAAWEPQSALAQGWHVVKADKAGQVHYHLLQYQIV